MCFKSTYCIEISYRVLKQWATLVKAQESQIIHQSPLEHTNTEFVLPFVSVSQPFPSFSKTWIQATIFMLLLCQITIIKPNNNESAKCAKNIGIKYVPSFIKIVTKKKYTQHKKVAGNYCKQRKLNKRGMKAEHQFVVRLLKTTIFKEDFEMFLILVWISNK